MVFKKSKYITLYDVFSYIYLFYMTFYHLFLKTIIYKQNVHVHGDRQALMAYIFFLELVLSDLVIEVY